MKFNELPELKIEKIIKEHLFNAGYFNCLDFFMVHGYTMTLYLQTRMYEPLKFKISIDLSELENEVFEDEKALCEALKPLIINEIHKKFFMYDTDIVFECLCNKYRISEETLNDILDDYDAMTEYAKMYSDGEVNIIVS